MPRALVVLPTSSYRTADFVAAADTLGIELSIASDQEPPLGALERFVQIDCDDVAESARAIADLATRTPIDAIVAADDAGVAMAAEAAAMLGLPHNSPAAVEATLDKLTLRLALDGGEIRQPRFAVLEEGDDVAAAMAAFDGPVVLKPSSLSASRGVIRVDDASAASAVAERIRDIQASHGVPRTQAILMERFVPGPEIAIEGTVWDGEFRMLAAFDKPEPLDGPYFEETIYVTPSRSPALDAVADLVRRAAATLGLTHGPIHAEVRVENGMPTLIEVAARSIGGLCGRALRFGLMGRSLETVILAQALGIDSTPARQPRAAGVLMVPIPRAGTLAGFAGVQETLTIDGVTRFEPAIAVGTSVTPPPEDGRYLGFVFAGGSDPEAVTAALRRAKQTLVPQIA